ncbi:MAG: CotH kinase family protein, partial [Crocinitomicaceae bacterium]|nr:CotH kinase family protein [Crocinitomicaceae bacterium]
MARNGKYSLALNTKKPNGFGITLEDIEKGDAVVVSVWRSIGEGNGSIIISGNDDAGDLYEENSTIIDKEGDWGLIEINFIADHDFEELIIYIRNDSKTTTYFDDITINGFLKHSIPKSTDNALRLEIDVMTMDSLELLRDKALKKGVITSKMKSYFAAKLIVDGKYIPVEIRFKGDWTDHLKTDKWSFRIKVSGDNAYKGLRSFSIQNPSTRSFMMEWFGHKLFENEDVLTTRYDFIPVIINGEKKGVYALEEHFDKQLLESRNRREGPIVKFDESGVWKQHLDELKGGQAFHIPTLLAAEINPFKKNRTKKNPILYMGFNVAQSHMDRLRKHDSDVNGYLDIDLVARYLALIDVLNAKHGLIWHNQSYYMNPVTSRLEPIAYDCFTSLDQTSKDVTMTGTDWRTKNSYSTTEALLSNPEVNELYLKYLKEFADPSYLEEIFKSLKHEISKMERLLKHEYPFYKFDKGFFVSNCKQIIAAIPEFEKKRSTVAKENFKGQVVFKKLPQGELYKDVALKAYVIEIDSFSCEIQLNNFHSYGIEIIGYTMKIDKKRMIDFEKPIRMKEYKWPSNQSTIILPVKPYSLVYRANNCNDELFYGKLSKWSPIERIEVPVSANYEHLPFKEVGDSLILAAGSYSVSKDVILPKGKLVVFKPGVKLDLINQAAFISYSPVLINGRSGQLIEITSSDKTANGFNVLTNNEKSVLRYVKFSNLGALNKAYWKLTGAVTFYQAQVSILNCIFENNHCEDGLNLVRCEFELDDSSILNASSDGFDADFCTGEVMRSYFENTGNDCMDFSGSTILIENCIVKNARDKAVSGGEGSHLTINDCVIDGAYIAIASKDLSSVSVSGIHVLNAEYGFAAYRKKPEYGPASISVISVIKMGVNNLYLL